MLSNSDKKGGVVKWSVNEYGSKDKDKCKGERGVFDYAGTHPTYPSEKMMNTDKREREGVKWGVSV